MKKLLLFLGLAFTLTFVGIQFVPVERTNPRVVADFDDDPAVEAVLRRACYDCHSNETVWPWYSRVAPISWSVAGHVEHGREELNFSQWGRMPESQRDHKREESWEEIESGEMPHSAYLPLHPEARLSAEDLDLLEAWGTAPAGP